MPATQAAQLSEEATRILQTAADLGVSMDVVFVPFSQSRNAKPNPRLGDLALNWRITLLKSGRPFLTTNYSAGIAYAPSYNRATPPRFTSSEQAAIIQHECEHGKPARIKYGQPSSYGSDMILPALQDVLYSLALDASVLNYSDFEDWAPDFGVDPDSRAGEKTYRACLDIALKMRAALGDDGLSKLHTACEGY